LIETDSANPAQVKATASVLVVDDEAFARRFFETILRQEGLYCNTVGTAGESYKYLENEMTPDLLILDVRLPDGNGLEILEWLRTQEISIPVIVVTAFGSIEDAVRAMKSGAFDFFTKPFEDTNRIKISIKNAIEHGRLRRENLMLKNRLQSKTVFQNIIGKSMKMQAVFEIVEKAARVPSNILIEGESGTGKDLIAKAIHDLSGQRHHAFIPVNCAALPEPLLESALFGYEKGAFTGAARTTIGFFEEANQGTLFLDEIGEAPSSVQVKILRAVEKGAIYRVGRTKPIRVSVRLIFATNKDLGKEVAEGRFRRDLFYRINTIKIILPPLRERKEDIPLLINHFQEEYCQETRLPKKRFEASALSYLIDRQWPGNIRELRNFIERVMALHSREILTLSDLHRYFEDALSAAGTDLFDVEYNTAKNLFEREYFERLLSKSEGDLNLAASYSGIHIATIYRKIKALQIEQK
jgi:DNA-binding NtrC family response regulator